MDLRRRPDLHSDGLASLAESQVLLLDDSVGDHPVLGEAFDPVDFDLLAFFRGHLGRLEYSLSSLFLRSREEIHL